MTLATLAFKRFLLCCLVQVLPSRRRGHGSDSNEADVITLSCCSLSDDWLLVSPLSLVVDFKGRTSLERLLRSVGDALDAVLFSQQLGLLF